jgi:Bifunctional DNA primase/polymerase, N-terminal
MSAMLDMAFSYIESSPQWPLFPVGPHKRPLIKTGRDHAEHASTDPATIERWLTRDYPGCGIGMPTGAPSGTVVIDIDAKHDGDALLAELEHPDVLGPLPRERVVRTRSGGLHIYAAHPGVRVSSVAGPGSQLGRLLSGRPGIDVRGDGGIVVLPPSAGYRWIADDDGPLPSLPALWLAAIQGAGDPPPPPRPAPVLTCDDARRLARARAYLARIPGAVEGSGGHTQTFEAIAAVMIGFDLDEATTRALIASDYNPRCSPPWSERELEHKLASVANRCRRERGYLLAETRP